MKTGKLFHKSLGVAITHPYALCLAALEEALWAANSWVDDIASSNIKFPIHKLPLYLSDHEILIHLDVHCHIAPLPSSRDFPKKTGHQ